MDLSQGINGVFKGGGAKGIVYAGALRAAQERGLSFRAVAGSSAGAITAALVAVGLPADELDVRTGDALRSVRWRTFTGFLPWTQKSIFSVDRLERWIESLLQERVGSNDAPVTFAALHGATGIELNVVAMDLARKQPVVFNHITAPTCAVATAVVASCAIPVVMPAGRVVMRSVDGTEEVHRVVDGGAWANYPAFVFKDESFRRSRGLEVSPRPTVGFVIDPPDATRAAGFERPVALGARRRSPTDRGAGSATGIVGALLNWRMLRVGTLVAAPVVLAVTLLSWLRSQLLSFFPVVDALPNVLEPLAVVVLVLMLSTLVTLTAAITLVLLRVGRELFDVGLPSALAALTVGPGVPDWVGAHPSDHVVRLSSPTGVRTTKFKIDDAVRTTAIAHAHDEAAQQLDGLVTNGVISPRPAAPATPVTTKRRGARLPLGVLLLLAFPFGARLAIGMARELAIGRDAAALRSGVVLAVGTVATVLLLARNRRIRAETPAPRRSAGSVWAQFGATSVCVGVMTALLFNVDVGSLSRFEDATRHRATVTRVTARNANTVYEVELAAPLPPLRGGTALRHCGEPRRRTCIVFGSLLTDLRVGDETRVLFVPERSEAFLAGEEWQNFKLDAAAFNLGLWLAFVLFFFWAIEDLRGNVMGGWRRGHAATDKARRPAG